MDVVSPLHDLIVFAAAFAAGAINAVAGGGSLVTFPTLVWLGLPAVTANATNTVALLPGTLGSMWGYRRELRTADRRLLLLVAPSLVGGIGGALLLRRTPAAVFDDLVPLLILFATLLFVVQEPIQRRVTPADGHAGARWAVGALLFQLLVGLYGGYFGAGIGILMLAALGILGLTDIHQMNGFKNMLAFAINGIAAGYFIVMQMVSWQDVVMMSAGAIAGGIAGAGGARRAGPVVVRRLVVIIGFGMACSLLLLR